MLPTGNALRSTGRRIFLVSAAVKMLSREIEGASTVYGHRQHYVPKETPDQPLIRDWVFS